MKESEIELQPVPGLILNFLLKLTAEIDTEHVDKVRKNFPKYFKSKSTEGIDVGRTLAEFMAENFIDDDKTITVLKGCTQSPLALAAMYLKGILTTQYLFRDVRGEWFIRIDINKEYIRISHKKAEQSVNSEESQFFFTWQFEITLDPSTFVFSSYSIRILTLGFGPKTEKSHQNAIRTKLKHFL